LLREAACSRRLALRRRERHAGPPRQSGAARAQAVPARQGLHRAQRRGRHHRRVHRPHDAGPALSRKACIRRWRPRKSARPAREPDARLDHLPELFPPLQEARRHDRHGGDRSRRVRRHLQARRRRDSDQRAGAASRRGRRGLSHGGERSCAPSSREIEAANARPAGAGRHDLDREVRTDAARRLSQESRLQADRFRQAAGAADALRRRARRQAIEAVRRAERPLPRAGSLYRRGGRRAGRVTIATNMAGRGTDIQLGGNVEMRIVAQELAGGPRTRAERARSRAARRSRRGRGPEAGRRSPPAASSSSAPSATKPPHRQPAARPLRPPGRPRPVEVLPVARGRPDAHLRLGPHGFDAAEARPQGGEAIVHPWINKALERRSRRSRRATSTSARTSSNTTT
jgi:hypothetical protein